MVREKTKVKEGIHDLTTKDGVIITKDEEKANILNSGQLPKEWKEANIVPIYKKGKSQIQITIGLLASHQL